MTDLSTRLRRLIVKSKVYLQTRLTSYAAG
jgi:hypothetical protein